VFQWLSKVQLGIWVIDRYSVNCLYQLSWQGPINIYPLWGIGGKYVCYLSSISRLIQFLYLLSQWYYQLSIFYMVKFKSCYLMRSTNREKAEQKILYSSKLRRLEYSSKLGGLSNKIDHIQVYLYHYLLLFSTEIIQDVNRCIRLNFYISVLISTIKMYKKICIVKSSGGWNTKNTWYTL